MKVLRRKTSVIGAARNRHRSPLLILAVGFALAPVLLPGVGRPIAGELSGRRVLDSLDHVYSPEVAEHAAFNPSGGLSTYLEYAANSNTAVRSAFYRWQAAVEKTGYVGVLPDPKVTYAYYIENVETRVGPQEHRLGLQQSFPWFGTLGAQKDVASQAANAAFEKFESTLLHVFFKIKSAYYDFYFLGQDIAITRDNLELLTFWEQVARTKYKVGLQQHSDVIKAQVELGKLEDRLASLEDQRQAAAARLRAAASLSDTIGLPLPETIDFNEEELDRTEVVQEILRNNPDLQSMQVQIKRAEAARRLAGKRNRPSFNLGVNYIATGEAINPDLSESGKDPWMVNVGISLPLWFGKNAARSREAEANHRRAQYAYEDSRNKLRALTERVLYEHSDALRKVQLYRDGLVPKAQQSLNATYTAYQAGETDFLNVLDAQRQLLQFELELERAKVSLATRRAQIEMLTGSKL